MKISFFKGSIICKTLQIIALLLAGLFFVYIKCFAHVDLSDPTLGPEFARKEIERREIEYQKNLDQIINRDQTTDKKERDKQIEKGNIKGVCLLEEKMENENIYCVFLSNKIYVINEETGEILDVFYSFNHMNTEIIKKPKFTKCSLKIYSKLDEEQD